MNERIQKKIDEFKKMAISLPSHTIPFVSSPNRQDSLAKVIRNKKEAEEFMAELESAVKRSRLISP